jgi:hypothetical protein
MHADKYLVMAKYGDYWRLSRRLFHQGFNSKTSFQYKEIQMKYARLAPGLLAKTKSNNLESELTLHKSDARFNQE